jgi:hypothetical protein
MISKKPNIQAFNSYIPYLGKSNLKPHIAAKMTPGVGDLMVAMNIAYMRSLYLQRTVTLDLHWYHDKDFLYHFEDPETIIERGEYIKNFYSEDFVDVRVRNIFNSSDTRLIHHRYVNFDRTGYKRNKDVIKQKIRYNDWYFRKCGFKTIDKKIVVWTQVGNAQPPRLFKRPFDRSEWNDAISIIEMQGYSVVEIDYRTPISEVMYHIGTSEACLCYEGMWHYVAKNFCKPMIVLTKDLITQYHTPDALIYKVRKADQHSMSYFYNFDRRVEVAKKFAEAQKKRIRGYYVED